MQRIDNLYIGLNITSNNSKDINYTYSISKDIFNLYFTGTYNKFTCNPAGDYETIVRKLLFISFRWIKNIWKIF